MIVKPLSLRAFKRLLVDMPLPERVVEFGAAAIEEIEHLRKQRDELQKHGSSLVLKSQGRGTKLRKVADSLCTCPCCSAIWEDSFGVEPPKDMSDEHMKRARREAEYKI